MKKNAKTLLIVLITIVATVNVYAVEQKDNNSKTEKSYVEQKLVLKEKRIFKKKIISKILKSFRQRKETECQSSAGLGLKVWCSAYYFTKYL